MSRDDHILSHYLHAAVGCADRLSHLACAARDDLRHTSHYLNLDLLDHAALSFISARITLGDLTDHLQRLCTLLDTLPLDTD